MAGQQNDSYQALYRSCMKEAAAQGRSLMHRLVRGAAMTMPRRAAMMPDEHERKLLADAARTLLKHEGALCEAYPQALLSEFAHAISGDTRKAGALSFDSLELMGDEQMRESVDLLRLQQVVLGEVEASLAELNALICSVQGLRTVQADRNPLRPEVYVRSLRTVALQSPVPTAMRNRWMLYLGEALGAELAQLYRELCVMLRSQGVVEASFAAIPSPRNDASVPAAASLLTVKELRRLQESGPSGEQPGASARSLAQEVVRLMVENIAGDARLLAPVQRVVRELEPALLRLASGDPHFFSDRTNPARRLLDQATQRSMAWGSVDDPGFAAFIEPLQQAARALLSSQGEGEGGGAEPFAFALQSLEHAWDEQQRRDSGDRERAVRALLQAEQRNLLAEKIAKEMRSRADVAQAPREISRFIAGPWSQVLAQARLADPTGASDPGGFAAAIADLLWSSQPRAVAANPARLAKVTPQLMETVRQGLALIDYPPAATKRFLDHLAAAHERALQATERPGRPVALSTSMTREELEAMLGGDEDTGPAPWLGATEAQDSGFMHTVPSMPSRTAFQDTHPGFGDTRPRAIDLAPHVRDAGLQPGAWVELMIDGRWGRYQVTWASPHAMLFMFADAAGKTHSMTRQLLDRMLQSGSLRMVSAQAVVDGALDGVAQAALRNSLDWKV